MGFPGGSDSEESACSARDVGLIPGSGRFPGVGNGNPLQYSCLENPMNSMKRQNDRTLKDEFPRSVCAQYVSGDQWRNNSRKMKDGTKAKQHQL